MQTKQSSASTAVKWITRVNIKVLMILVLIGSLSGCANNPFYHKYVMSGQVVNVEVFRSVFINGGIDDGESLFRRETVGKIRLREIKDQHYAVATVINGEIRNHDMVELSSN